MLVENMEKKSQKVTIWTPWHKFTFTKSRKTSQFEGKFFMLLNELVQVFHYIAAIQKEIF